MANEFAPVINDHRAQNGKLTVPTDDAEVRAELRKLGEPITLFGEQKPERRQRLLRLVSEQKHTNFGFGETEDELMDEDEDQDDEEFYTPGTEALREARVKILHASVDKAHERIERQKKAALEHDFAKALKHRRHIADYVGSLELNGSYTLKGNSRTLSGVRLNKNNTKVACASWDGNIYLLDRDAELNFTDSSRIAPGFHTEKVTVSWSPTEDAVVSGGAEGTVNLWRVPETVSEERLKPISTVKTAHQGRIAQTDFHPSGQYFSTTSFDQTWKLWDVQRPETELLEQEGHAKEVYASSFHPDGSLIATGGLDAVGRVWDLRSGRSIAIMEGHAKGIYSMSWSPNGYHIASASGDCSVKIWDMRKVDKYELFSIPAHTKLVSDVRFLPSTAAHAITQPVTDENDENALLLDVSGTVLVTASYDTTVKVWSADNWVPIKTLQGHTDKVMSCDVSSDGLFVVSCGWDRALRTWGHV